MTSPLRDPSEATAGGRWKRHDGTPGWPDADYLVEPDPRLGVVLSADTNSRRGGADVPDAGLRFRMNQWAAGVGTLSALGSFIWCGFDLARSTGSKRIPSFGDLLLNLGLVRIGIVVIGTVGPILLARALVKALHPKQSSFVGRDGVQRTKFRRAGGPATDVVPYAGCARLEIERIRHHLNGAYTGTSFCYELRDATLRTVFVIKGLYNDKKKGQVPMDLHFAQALERAWNQRRRPG